MTGKPDRQEARGKEKKIKKGISESQPRWLICRETLPLKILMIAQYAQRHDQKAQAQKRSSRVIERAYEMIEPRHERGRHQNDRVNQDLPPCMAQTFDHGATSVCQRAV